MLRWVEAMARHGGGGGTTVTYGFVFFCWLCGQLLMVEHYAYARTDFRDEPDLSLSEDDQWNDRGKKDAIFIVFFYFLAYFIFCVFCVILRHSILHCKYWSIATSWRITYREMRGGEGDCHLERGCIRGTTGN